MTTFVGLPIWAIFADTRQQPGRLVGRRWSAFRSLHAGGFEQPVPLVNRRRGRRGVPLLHLGERGAIQ